VQGVCGEKRKVKSISHKRTPIYCCGCGETVDARLTSGREIYPRRHDLAHIPIWKCDACGSYVGCHRKTKNPMRPLGHIPTKAIHNARQRIHAVLDPLWKSGGVKRSVIYKKLSDRLGWGYHTAKIRSIEEAAIVLEELRKRWGG